MLTPSEFIQLTTPGSDHEFSPGIIIEYNEDLKTSEYMTVEMFEACIARYYNYTKTELSGDVYFTLGTPRVSSTE